MKNRIIAFGYEIRDGKLTISNTEAEYVRRIFEKRVSIFGYCWYKFFRKTVRRYFKRRKSNLFKNNVY